MGQAHQAVSDLPDPLVYQFPHFRLLQPGENLPAIAQLREPGLHQPDQSRGGSVAFITSAEHIPGRIPVLGMGHDAAEFPRGKAAAHIDLPAYDDSAAHARAVGETEEIVISLSRAVTGFPQGRAVHVVEHRRGNMKIIFNQFPDLGSGIAGDVVVGVSNHPLLRIHLTGGTDAHGLEIPVSRQYLHYGVHDVGSAQAGIGIPLPDVRQGAALPQTRFDAGAADIHCGDSQVFDVCCVFCHDRVSLRVVC